jgi:formylglycine-generating enzyme
VLARAQNFHACDGIFKICNTHTYIPKEKTMKIKNLSMIFIVAAMVSYTVIAQDVTIDLVPVDNAGNAPDIRYVSTGFGAVNYDYQIGKYEVTNAQWREFLTVKAAMGDPNGLYNTHMADNPYGGIDRSGSGTGEDPYIYSAKGGDSNWDNRPVNFVSFWDAARFCNWMQNGQGSSDTETGAYINIGNPSTFARQPGAQYFIPTENEWYKAAYYDPHKAGGAGYWDYPTGTNDIPNNGNPGGDTGNSANFFDGGYTIGSPYGTTPMGYFSQSDSPYGTFDQGGNLWEWIDPDITGSLVVDGILRSGIWNDESFLLAASYRFGADVSDETLSFGFRVAYVPEPGSLTLLVCGAIAGLIWRRRRR